MAHPIQIIFSEAARAGYLSVRTFCRPKKVTSYFIMTAASLLSTVLRNLVDACRGVVYGLHSRRCSRYPISTGSTTL